MTSPLSARDRALVKVPTSDGGVVALYGHDDVIKGACILPPGAPDSGYQRWDPATDLGLAGHLAAAAYQQSAALFASAVSAIPSLVNALAVVAVDARSARQEAAAAQAAAASALARASAASASAASASQQAATTAAGLVGADPRVRAAIEERVKQAESAAGVRIAALETQLARLTAGAASAAAGPANGAAIAVGSSFAHVPLASGAGATAPQRTRFATRTPCRGGFEPRPGRASSPNPDSEDDAGWGSLASGGDSDDDDSMTAAISSLHARLGRGSGDGGGVGAGAPRGQPSPPEYVHGLSLDDSPNLFLQGKRSWARWVALGVGWDRAATAQWNAAWDALLGIDSPAKDRSQSRQAAAVCRLLYSGVTPDPSLCDPIVREITFLTIAACGGPSSKKIAGGVVADMRASTVDPALRKSIAVHRALARPAGAGSRGGAQLPGLPSTADVDRAQARDDARLRPGPRKAKKNGAENASTPAPRPSRADSSHTRRARSSSAAPHSAAAAAQPAGNGASAAPTRTSAAGKRGGQKARSSG
jgi:hypothetical protein